MAGYIRILESEGFENFVLGYVRRFIVRDEKLIKAMKEKLIDIVRSIDSCTKACRYTRIETDGRVHCVCDNNDETYWFINPRRISSISFLPMKSLQVLAEPRFISLFIHWHRRLPGRRLTDSSMLCTA